MVCSEFDYRSAVEAEMTNVWLKHNCTLGMFLITGFYNMVKKLKKVDLHGMSPLNLMLKPMQVVVSYTSLSQNMSCAFDP